MINIWNINAYSSDKCTILRNYKKFLIGHVMFITYQNPVCLDHSMKLTLPVLEFEYYLSPHRDRFS